MSLYYVICDQEQADAVRIEYRALLMEGEVECPKLEVGFPVIMT
jgi:hypothetical protein